MLSSFYIEDHIKSALNEDIGFGDITTENLTGESDILSAVLDTRTEFFAVARFLKQYLKFCHRM